jgi:thiol-disulfide isomerase/thioredoxin
MKILKFYSDTCGPCKTLGENLVKANISHIAYNAEDDDNEELLSKYSIRGLPTLVKTDDEGNVLDKHTGLMTVDQLLKWCE